MMRPRLFDPDTLRERVTDVFIENGYRGTSMSMLTEACGLGKQSLYNAIGDKEAAYLQSLDCVSSRHQDLKAAIDQAPTGRQAIDLFFSELTGACLEGDALRSTCMLTSGVMEGIADEAIAAKLKEKWAEMSQFLLEVVERGQRDRSIRGDVAGTTLRDLLMTLLLGMRVASKAPCDHGSLASTVRFALKLLDEGSPLP